MINKHEIPILEFDDNPQAVIMPTHEDLGLDLPPRCCLRLFRGRSRIAMRYQLRRKSRRICLCHQSLSCFCHEFTTGRKFVLASSSSWLMLQLHNLWIG